MKAICRVNARKNENRTQNQEGARIMDNHSALYADLERILVTQEEIQKAVRELGQQITRDYAGKAPVMICILKGAVVFFSDLAREIDLPVSLTTIGDDAFEKCSSLKSIKLPVGVTSIGSDAFLECTMLTSVDLSTALKKIGGSAFAKCVSLKEVILHTPAPPSISKSTFKGCMPVYIIPRGSLPIYIAHKDWKSITGYQEK